MKAQGLALLAALLMASGAQGGTPLSCLVTQVHDGDTLKCLAGNKEYKVRLAEIDAPELAQPFGTDSRASLAGLVKGKTVTLDIQTTDKYGRSVARIQAGAVDVNREQVRKGMAWAYRFYLKDQSLIQVETEAKNAKTGLWKDPSPTPPWDYRHGKKSGMEPVSSGFRNYAPNSTKATNESFSCSKRYCKQMTSCAEAMYHLQHCGMSRLDADGDGVPCEALCK